MNDLYTNGFALVIGGSGGVGTAICHELVANSIPVLLTYNSNRERAEQLVDDSAPFVTPSGTARSRCSGPADTITVTCW
mgnify:CR=1 FL=1